MSSFLDGNSRISVFTHTQYRDHRPVHGPSDTLSDFFKKSTQTFSYLKHSIYRGDGSYLEVYKNGELSYVKKNTFSRNFPDCLRYVIDLFFTLNRFIFTEYSDVIVAADPLNFFYAYILKKFRKTKTIIYYTLDYAYQRFRNPILNRIYHCLDSFAVRRADVLWNSCRKVKELRDKQSSSKKNIYIPNTPVSHGVSIKGESEIDKFSLVNIFSNHKQVDFPCMFNALSGLIRKYPKVSLKLIGRGDFQKEVMPYVQDEKILPHIRFMDISSHAQALEEVSKSAIGLECNAQIDSWNEFREPIKIMEYINFGLPIISKPSHTMVDEIAAKRIGFIIKDSDELFEKIDLLFSEPALYKEIRENVCNLSKSLDKEKRIIKSLNELIAS